MAAPVSETEPTRERTHKQESGQVKLIEESSLRKDPSKGLDQTLALLKATDDTSRFVGLALLKSILDHQQDFQKDPEVIRRCWATISARFLDRLLRASANEKRSKEESQSMVELAVAILHAFTVLLPHELRNDKKFVGRIEGLLCALAQSAPDSKTQTLQILVTLASTRQGATALLNAEHWSRLIELSPEHDLVLDVIKCAFTIIYSQNLAEPSIQQTMNYSLAVLIDKFQGTSKQALLVQAFYEILIVLPAGVPLSSPPWLGPLADLICQSTLSRPGSTLARYRRLVVLLTALLLCLFPVEFTPLLFNGPEANPVSQDSKPVSYLFVKLLLIDVRSTIPSLHESISSDESPPLDALAASYDILSAFIGFLVRLLDEEIPSAEDFNKIIQPSTSPFTPSLLLQLRVDISEAVSLTIESLRDRFNTLPSPLLATAGPSTSYPSSTSSQDPLALSQTRALALWLREDDNYALRKEAASITDILLGFYTVEDDPTHAFRSPVLIALEGIVAVPEGVEAFLAAEGWDILTKDLCSILSHAFDPADSLRGIEIVRVLLAVAESDVVGPVKEDWMVIVDMVTSSMVSEDMGLELELGIAVAQLAVELLVRAPRNVRRRWMEAADGVANVAREILRRGYGGNGVLEGAKEVLGALQGLGVGVGGG